jgi:pimeloyl-ACP methyl ester carboxylesterase
MSSRQEQTVRLDLPDGGALHLYLSQPARPCDWAVVYAHGLGSRRTGEKALALEAACARREWVFASFDFRGHGESSGSLLELRSSGLLDDLATVRGHLAELGIRRLCLVGSSMGGWAAAWFAVRHPDAVPACVLVAPAFDFPRGRWARLSDGERLQWQQTGRLRVRSEWIDTEIGYSLVEEVDQFPVEVLADRLSCPLLIFHGMQDEQVPFSHSVALAEQAASPKIELRVYKDGDHRLLPYKDEMAEAACVHFARCM